MRRPKSPKPSSVRGLAAWTVRKGEQEHQAVRSQFEEARKTWRLIGRQREGARRQFLLMREIIETRGAELKRAYPGVRSIACGYRRRTNRLKREHCITFVVDAKKPHHQLADAERIPGELLAYTRVRNQRRLVAVPTDVEDGDIYRRIIPHTVCTAKIEACTPALGVLGVITALVRIIRSGSSEPGLFALSCAHVFNLAQEYYENYAHDTQISLNVPTGDPRKGNVFGAASSHLGFIRHQFLFSFDASLVEIDQTKLTLLEDAVCKRRPSKVAWSYDQIPDTYQIWAPNQEPISAEKHHHWAGAELTINYKNSMGNPVVDVWHRELVESKTAVALAEGDSGSPVISSDGSLFLGMHIAGSGGSAYMIPAWQLVDAGNYYDLSTKDSIQLTSTY